MSAMMSRTDRALDLSTIVFSRMQAEDLREVLSIENSVYPFPWTPGNFMDALNSAYHGCVARDLDRNMAGYFLMMFAVDEAHLLNITVKQDLHGMGCGRRLLDRAVLTAQENGMLSILLEVRPSNQRALAVYEQYGFIRIGRRRDYYPAANGTREDAIVMRLVV